jgi:hypothetical protein
MQDNYIPPLWSYVRKRASGGGPGPDKGSVCAIASSIENTANAALIAAAPDLLDALRRVLRHIPADAGGASMSDDMHRARRAIARATGRT